MATIWLVAFLALWALVLLLGFLFLAHYERSGFRAGVWNNWRQPRPSAWGVMASSRAKRPRTLHCRARTARTSRCAWTHPGLAVRGGERAPVAGTVFIENNGSRRPAVAHPGETSRKAVPGTRLSRGGDLLNATKQSSRWMRPGFTAPAFGLRAPAMPCSSYRAVNLRRVLVVPTRLNARSSLAVRDGAALGVVRISPCHLRAASRVWLGSWPWHSALRSC
jgi:hypothetical protein